MVNCIRRACTALSSGLAQLLAQLSWRPLAAQPAGMLRVGNSRLLTCRVRHRRPGLRNFSELARPKRTSIHKLCVFVREPDEVHR